MILAQRQQCQRHWMWHQIRLKLNRTHQICQNDTYFEWAAEFKSEIVFVETYSNSSTTTSTVDSSRPEMNTENNTSDTEDSENKTVVHANVAWTTAQLNQRLKTKKDDDYRITLVAGFVVCMAIIMLVIVVIIAALAKLACCLLLAKQKTIQKWSHFNKGLNQIPTFVWNL